MAVIGITPCNRLSDYVESVRRAGGEPRVLSADAEPTLEGLDGILFTGGGDLDPVHYRQVRHSRTNEPDAARDAYELALAKLALASDAPILADQSGARSPGRFTVVCAGARSVGGP
jgi:putative glutamine amidotransferase